VCGAERVVHVEAEAGGEILREGRVVALLLGMEAHVLEEDGVATLQPADRGADLGSDAVREQRDRPAEELPETRGDRRQALLRVTTLRTAEMRAERESGAALEQRRDRRQRGADPGVVG